MKKYPLVFAALIILSLLAGPALAELNRPPNQAMPLFSVKFPVVRAAGQSTQPEQYEHWSRSGSEATVQTTTYEEPCSQCVAPEPVYVQPVCPATPCQGSGGQVIEVIQYYQPGQVVSIEYVE